jgi:Rrf2 family nitric oxide-sensitive transcriptional repressor
MNLTLQSDYTFRILMTLAARAPETVTIQEIADHYSISKGHLMVIVHRLGGLGFLENIRGRGGGIRLARPASDIRLDEIVKAVEPGFDLVECFRPDSNHCLITKPCILRKVLADALQAWFDVLHQYTVADLVGNNPPLLLLLQAQPPEGRTKVLKSSM